MKNIKTIELDWNEVSDRIAETINEILNLNIQCDCSQDAFDFWGVRFIDARITIDDIKKLCFRINANETAERDAYPIDDDGVNDFGVCMANALLAYNLNISFENYLVLDDKLLLIDVK